MARLALSVLAAAFVFAAVDVGAAKAGNCDYDHQTASDGSRCGDRSAASRPGG